MLMVSPTSVRGNRGLGGPQKGFRGTLKWQQGGGEGWRGVVAIPHLGEGQWGSEGTLKR